MNHTEWGIARDFLLLGYKYGLFDQDYQSFAATVAMNFAPLGNMGTYRMLQGMGKNYDMLVSAKPFLDLFRATDKPAYDFKFLEIFSNAKAFETCINSAASRLLPARTVWH